MDILIRLQSYNSERAFASLSVDGALAGTLFMPADTYSAFVTALWYAIRGHEEISFWADLPTDLPGGGLRWPTSHEPPVAL